MNPSRAYQPLRKSREFRAVYEKGQRYHSPYFSIFILSRSEGETRVGITVTRKVGNAVVRNRCKRRLREVARKFFHLARMQNAVPAGIDLVINAKSELILADFQSLEESFARSMKKYFDSLERRTGGRIVEAAQ